MGAKPPKGTPRRPRTRAYTAPNRLLARLRKRLAVASFRRRRTKELLLDCISPVFPNSGCMEGRDGEQGGAALQRRLHCGVSHSASEMQAVSARAGPSQAAPNNSCRSLGLELGAAPRRAPPPEPIRPHIITSSLACIAGTAEPIPARALEPRRRKPVQNPPKLSLNNLSNTGQVCWDQALSFSHQDFAPLRAERL